MIAACERLGYLRKKIEPIEAFYRTGFFNVENGDVIANDAQQHYWWWLKQYPDAKFILTLRDESVWLRSLKAHFSRTPPSTEHRRLKRVGILGLYDFNEDFHRAYFRRYNTAVIAHFAGADNLLVHHTGKDGFESLCPFLGVPAINEQYPWENKAG